MFLVRTLADGRADGPEQDSKRNLGGLPLRVLVIDDSEISRDVMRDILEGGGCTVRTLESPLGATAEVVRFEADVVVIDVNMPVMSGARFVELIRKNYRLLHVKLVLVSGDSEAELRRLGEELQADAVLPKKILADRLVPTLLALTSASGERPTAVEDTRKATKPHVMLLDDDARGADEVRRRLERLGYEVNHRRSGRGILVAVLLERTRFVLIGTKLSDMPGRAVAELLRSNHATERLPIVLVGDGTDSELASEALRWRASGFVSRSSSESVFRERLERIVPPNE